MKTCLFGLESARLPVSEIMVKLSIAFMVASLFWNEVSVISSSAASPMPSSVANARDMYTKYSGTANTSLAASCGAKLSRTCRNSSERPRRRH